MKDAKVNMNRPPLSEDEIDKAKNFDQLMEMNAEPPIKIKWGKIGGIIAVVAGVLGFVFWPANKDENGNEAGTTSAETNNFNSEFFDQTNVPSITYTVNGAQGDSIITEKGTKIIIPPNAFKDEKGNTILDDVEISFREFHDVPSIFGSNVDMTYDSAGMEYHFESAGMIEIGGMKDGKKILIDENNPLIVELNSQYPGDHYNIYFMDPDGDWEFIKKDTARLRNSEEQLGEYLALNSLDYANKEQKVFLEQKAEKAKAVHNAYQKELKDAGLIVPQKADNDLFSVKLKFKESEFPELKGYKNVLFEVTEKNIGFDKTLADQQWSDIELSKNADNYLMTLFGAQKVKLFVRPVFAGEDMEVAQGNFEELFAAYDAAHAGVLSAAKEEMTTAYQNYKATEDSVINVINQQINQLAWQGELDAKKNKVKRVFEIDNFGFWNSDCPQNLPKGQEVDPVFVNTDAPQDTLSFTNLYIAEYDKNAFFTYWGYWGHQKYVDDNGKERQIYEALPFTFNPKSETVLWAITNKGELAVLTPDALKTINFSESGNSSTIRMKIHKDINAIKNIKEAIGWK